MADKTIEIKDQIRGFVLENLAPRKGLASVTDDESLIDNGVVDSLGVFQLVAFMEEAFRIRIGDEEINGENFHTVAAIEGFVRAKLGR